MTFDDAVAFVLRPDIEGVRSNDADDAGGLTHWGISQRAHPGVDVATLTRDGAIAIYEANYWRPVRCPDLLNPLRLPVFDGAVQHGVPMSARLLQVALDVEPDGLIGPRTLAAAQTQPWADVLRRYFAERMLLYAARPNWGRYGRGWARRLFACQQRVYEVRLGVDHDPSILDRVAARPLDAGAPRLSDGPATG